MKPFLALFILFLSSCSLLAAVPCLYGDDADGVLNSVINTKNCENGCTRRQIWRPFGTNSIEYGCDSTLFPCWFPGNYCCDSAMCNMQLSFGK